MRNTLLMILLLRMFCPYSIGQDTCTVNGIFINSLLIDPTGSENNYDTNGDGSVDSNDEFIEICNSSSEEVDLSGWILGDNDPPPYPDYTFPNETFLAAGDCLVLVAKLCPMAM